MMKVTGKTGKYKWEKFNKEEYLDGVNKKVDKIIEKDGYEAAVRELKYVVEAMATAIELLG